MKVQNSLKFKKIIKSIRLSKIKKRKLQIKIQRILKLKLLGKIKIQKVKIKIKLKYKKF